MNCRRRLFHAGDCAGSEGQAFCDGWYRAYDFFHLFILELS
jgi:hypothetical protein